MRAVERERARLDLRQADVAMHARQVLAEQVIGWVVRIGHVVDRHDATAHLHRRLDRLRQAGARRDGFLALRIVEVADDQAVDHDFDRVPLVPFQVDIFADIAHFAVDTHAHEAALLDLFEHLLVAPLAVLDHGAQHLDARAVGPLLDRLDDLLGRLGLDALAADGTVRDADPRVEQAQIVVDLGHGADRRARVLRGRLLVDRDRGGEAVDRIDVRLLHLAQKLPRVRGQRLHIAPLPLGIDRVERERALARARKSGHDDQAVARELDGDVL